MADGHGATVSTGGRLGERGPFRAPRAAAGELAGRVTGELPGWLRGRLVRTAPARFRSGAWEAAHWFDGLGMLYAFELGEGGARLVHRDLDSETARATAAGRRDIAGFATPMKRSLWARLLQPIPSVPDNTNVNVVPRGDGFAALTETSRQLRVDAATLAVTGEHRWGDALGPLSGTAHPVFDRGRRVWVDVCTDLGFRPGLAVIEHDPDGRARTLVARWKTPSLPYVHSFGVTERSVVIVAHPLTLNPARMLFSDKGYADHFAWADAEMQLVIVDRATGATRTVTAPKGFVFHVADAFEDDRGLTLDAVAYDDASVIDQLRAGPLTGGPVRVSPRALRYRVPRGAKAATVEALSPEGFEFPVVDRRGAGDRRFTWGARLVLDGERSTSTLVALDGAARTEATHAEDDWVFGEPVFARRPGSGEEGDGVLLTVGSHNRDDRALLRVLDARSLRVLAGVEVDVPLPLGFHGGFAPARP
ncbi:MAG: carotenoid oxygenase family protein [Polyangiales bacterium]